MKKSTDALLRIATATPESLPQLLALYEHLAADNIQMDLDLATKRLAAFHAIAGSAVFVGYSAGKQVLSHAIEHAWHHDCYKVMLLTGSQKPETHAFYRRAGFEASKTGYQIRRISPRAD
nr:GNAT family N-acetyltransferase [uncultured Cohaesibacter sp.]